MTKLFKSTALALAASSVALTAVPAEARSHGQRYEQSSRYDHYGSRYNAYGNRYDHRQPVYQNNRARQARNVNYYCRKNDGTTGLLIGGAAGALLGRTVDTRGDRTLGTLLGAAAGALLGKTVEQGSSRCR